MRYEVIEAFNSTNQRFLPGMVVDAAEIDSPVPVERWVAIGKLKPLPDPKPDFATGQIVLREAWVARGWHPVDQDIAPGDVIRIADQELYGALNSSLDGPAVDIQILDEDGVRRYPLAALDRATRSVSGDYTVEHQSRRARTALVTAVAERINAPAEPSSADVPQTL